MVTGQFGLKQPLSDFCEIAADPRSRYHTSTLIPESEGFRGGVPPGMATISAIAPTTAPEGEHLSYNGTTMLAEADHGILWRPPDNVVREFPQFPATRTYDELRAAFLQAAGLRA
ncbi:MAG: hypothetical protein HY699_24175 [Deltaproteobacteria bacterium]|nr:hypothetical protein [Deltaproteobacteria bacterium]